jgi:ankyrin repeat protein
MKGGRHIRYDEPTPLANLHLTLLDKVGVRLDSFADSTGGADFRTPLPSGFTPLLFAVREGQLDVVRVLLKAGADVNEAMEVERRPSDKSPLSGTSPLILAVENGHFELAVELLKHGADPNDQRSGFAPLHVLSWVRKPNRGDGPDGDPPPQGSGSLGSLDFARELVARGADVNLRLKRGKSGRGILGRRGATPFLLAAVTADVLDRSAHAHQPARARRRTTLADILGYHYYTELAHSAGMPKDQIEEPGLDPRRRCAG